MTDPNSAIKEAAMPINVVARLEEDWHIDKLLGSGSQGQVWIAHSLWHPEKRVAVKLLRYCGDAQREVAAYERLRTFDRHPNVLDVQFGLADR